MAGAPRSSARRTTAELAQTRAVTTVSIAQRESNLRGAAWETPLRRGFFQAHPGPLACRGTCDMRRADRFERVFVLRYIRYKWSIIDRSRSILFKPEDADGLRKRRHWPGTAASRCRMWTSCASRRKCWNL